MRATACRSVAGGRFCKKEREKAHEKAPFGDSTSEQQDDVAADRTKAEWIVCTAKQSPLRAVVKNFEAANFPIDDGANGNVIEAEERSDECHVSVPHSPSMRWGVAATSIVDFGERLSIRAGSSAFAHLWRFYKNPFAFL